MGHPIVQHIPQAYNKENITGLLWGMYIYDWGIPLTKRNECGKCFLAMMSSRYTFSLQYSTVVKWNNGYIGRCVTW